MKELKRFLLAVVSPFSWRRSLVLLIAVSVFPVVHAQTATQIEITDLERRVGNFETLNLDHRLTAIAKLC